MSKVRRYNISILRQSMGQVLSDKKCFPILFDLLWLFLILGTGLGSIEVRQIRFLDTLANG
jgi:hypothetical protein